MNQTSTSTRSTEVYEFISALNIFLSITASLGNALILVALHKESSLRPPTKLLFRCLAVTDLCVGLISQPLFAVVMMSFVTNAINLKVKYYTTMINRASSFTLCLVSVLVSTAISVDRLLALLLGLRYRHVVTLRRVSVVIVSFWLIGVSWGTVLFFWDSTMVFTVAFALITLSIATSFICYTKIYLKLRHHQFQVHVPQGQPNGGGIPLNIARYKKTVSSVLWVQLALVACYAPFLVGRIVRIATEDQVSSNTFVAIFFAGTLTYLNSSLNPILYCWRIRAVRQAVKDTIKQLKYCRST